MQEGLRTDNGEQNRFSFAEGATLTDAIDLRLEEAQSEMKHLREALKRANERVGKGRGASILRQC